jgi:outer membrane protein assembly factor BamE (lipoprotein component of BamABCDE complex)
MRRWACALLAGVLLLAGCDQRRIAKLEEGVATDVRREFGEPAAVFAEPDGARTFEYPRQPEGQVNYFITIGADGKMSALRQVLKPASFDRVMPGMDKSAVRRLLGRPARMQRYAQKHEETWDWRWADGQEGKLFSVTFDDDGRVLASANTLDPSRATPK